MTHVELQIWPQHWGNKFTKSNKGDTHSFQHQFRPSLGDRSKEERKEGLKHYEAGYYVPKVRSNRQYCQEFVVSGCWVAGQLASVSLDFGALWFMQHDANDIHMNRIQVLITVFVSMMYSLDLLFRIYAFTLPVFLRKCWNIFDCFIVIGASVFAFFAVEGTDLDIVGGKRLVLLGRFARIIRILRMFTMMGQTSFTCCRYMRHVTGENKARFFSVTYDFDLDLVYITPRLISMSVPAAGYFTQLYRNQISEVVRFFETFHSQHYAIANCCPELPYPADAFTTGQIFHFDIQDHTPPLFADFLNFIGFAEAFLASDDNVLAVHCRGGKGRTGSLCCAWLIYNQDADDAEDALNFFAMRRTDCDRANMRKVQGVETPSQVRYVHYFETLLRWQGAYRPQEVNPPRITPLRLKHLWTFDMFHLTVPQELVAVVYDPVQSMSLYYSQVSDLSWDLGGTLVSGDVRISVYDHKKMHHNECTHGAKRKHYIAGTEPGCLFYFYFNTSFMEGTELVLPTSMIDKACKKPELFKEGGIRLSFSEF